MPSPLSTQPHLAELTAIRAKVEQLFSSLTTEQLNQKPQPEKWSVAQCLDHLIQSHQGYVLILKSITSGAYKPNTWQRISPLTNWFGNFLLKNFGATIRKAGKAPKPFQPQQSAIDAGIVQRFLTQQDELIAIYKMLDGTNHAQTIISSPALGLITLKVSAALDLIVGHEQRHLRQAEAVLQQTQAAA